jgi:hypothetical protein
MTEPNTAGDPPPEVGDLLVAWWPTSGEYLPPGWTVQDGAQWMIWTANASWPLPSDVSYRIIRPIPDDRGNPWTVQQITQELSALADDWEAEERTRQVVNHAKNLWRERFGNMSGWVEPSWAVKHAIAYATDPKRQQEQEPALVVEDLNTCSLCLPDIEHAERDQPHHFRRLLTCSICGGTNRRQVNGSIAHDHLAMPHAFIIYEAEVAARDRMRAAGEIGSAPDMDDERLARVRQETEQRVRESMGRAMDEMRERLTEGAEHQRDRASVALERLGAVREALLGTGFFEGEELGADLAPRVVEMYSALTGALIDLREDLRQQMLNAPQGTEARDTYPDGYASGLAQSIGTLDRIAPWVAVARPPTRQEPEPSEPVDEEMVARACADPGAFIGKRRGPWTGEEKYEPIYRWQARAVAHVLAGGEPRG